MPVAVPTAPPRITRRYGKSEESPLKILSAGFVAGAVSRSCTAPMDRLRSLMAAGQTSTLAGSKPSIASGLRAMYRAGGLRCMWQGNMTNVLQVGPESAILFFANGILKQKMAERADGSPLTMFQKFVCGASAGVISMTMVYPMYVVQNRMMVAQEGLYSSIRDCIVQTYRQEGLKAFSQGYLPSLIRIIPYKGIDLAGYAMLRDFLVSPGEVPSTIQSLSFGAAASCISQTVTHPLLLARTKLQCQGDAIGRPLKYKSMWDAIAKTFMRGYTPQVQNPTSHAKTIFHGIRMLWSGWAPSMAKNVPAIAIQFAVYEKTLEALDRSSDNMQFKC